MQSGRVCFRNFLRLLWSQFSQTHAARLEALPRAITHESLKIRGVKRKMKRPSFLTPTVAPRAVNKKSVPSFFPPYKKERRESISYSWARGKGEEAKVLLVGMKGESEKEEYSDTHGEVRTCARACVRASERVWVRKESHLLSLL